MAELKSMRRAFYRLHDEVLAARSLVDLAKGLDGPQATPWVLVVDDHVARIEAAMRGVEARLNGAPADGKRSAPAERMEGAA